MKFFEEQRIRSKVTGNEGVVLRSHEFVMIQFDNQEVVMMGTNDVEAIEPPPPIFPKGAAVICINPMWSTGLVATAIHQEGGKLWVVWDKSHWKYNGQLDGQYSRDSFAFYDASVLSEAA